MRQASVGSGNGRRQENVVNVAGQAGDGCKCDGWMLGSYPTWKEERE